MLCLDLSRNLCLENMTFLEQLMDIVVNGNEGGFCLKSCEVHDYGP